MSFVQCWAIYSGYHLGWLLKMLSSSTSLSTCFTLHEYLLLSVCNKAQFIVSKPNVATKESSHWQHVHRAYWLCDTCSSSCLGRKHVSTPCSSCQRNRLHPRPHQRNCAEDLTHYPVQSVWVTEILTTSHRNHQPLWWGLAVLYWESAEALDVCLNGWLCT